MTNSPANKRAIPFYGIACALAGLTFVPIPALHAETASPPVPAIGVLDVHEEPGVIVVRYGGRAGRVGIPSWKAVLRQDDAGNITALHVPADSPKHLGARENSLWSLTTLGTSTKVEIPATMSKGRENFARFPVETFKITGKSLHQIVVEVAGPSKNKHYEHRRRYTFTQAGVQIDGEVRALVDLQTVAFWPLWDRTQIAEAPKGTISIRSQGQPTWVRMPSSGKDLLVPLPEGVDFPLEAEIPLSRSAPTIMKVFYDQNFEAARGTRLIVHNDKDFPERNGVISYEKMLAMEGGMVPAGQRQSFKVRFEFETREQP